MKTNILAGWLLGAGALFGFVTWRLGVPERLPIENFGLVDRSGSAPKPCIALGGALQRIISSSPAGRSTWTFFVTGDARTAYEPVSLPVHSSLASHRLIDGKEQVDRQNAAFVSDVVQACNGMAVTDSSPLFLDVKDVVAQARRRADKAEVHVYVITDLQETAEAAVAQALKQSRDAKFLPGPIDVHGIRLHVCGYAQTVGHEGTKVRTAPRSAENVDRLIEVWSSLFSERAAVDFAPFCF